MHGAPGGCGRIGDLFMLAADGRIVTSEVGSAQWDGPSVVDFLEKLSKEAAQPESTSVPVSND